MVNNCWHFYQNFKEIVCRNFVQLQVDRCLKILRVNYKFLCSSVIATMSVCCRYDNFYKWQHKISLKIISETAWLWFQKHKTISWDAFLMPLLCFVGKMCLFIHLLLLKIRPNYSKLQNVVIFLSLSLLRCFKTSTVAVEVYFFTPVDTINFQKTLSHVHWTWLSSRLS